MNNTKKEDVVEKLKKFNEKKTGEPLVIPVERVHYRGFLPHYDFGGLYQMITYRLNDSLPKNIIENILKEITEESAQRKAIEENMDIGYGSCILGEPELANIVIENWKNFDKQRYDLIAYVVMPNHVHVLIRVYEKNSLSKIVHSWKSYSSKKMRDYLNMAGKLAKCRTTALPDIGWQADYWDRFIRDEKHFSRVIEYIHFNPVTAKLCTKPEDWLFSSFNQFQNNK